MMRNTFIIITCLCTMLITSCTSSNIEKTYIEKYANRLMSQYPNFASNDIAKKAIADSISNHATSFIGKTANDIEGVEFRFDKLIKGKNGYCAIFLASPYTLIENPVKNGKKYLGATIEITAFGNISDATASQLNKDASYSLSGILHAWDNKNMLDIYRPYAYDALDFGIYIIDNLTVKEISENE